MPVSILFIYCVEGGEGKKVTRLVLICWVAGGEGKHVKRLANLGYLQCFGVDDDLSLAFCSLLFFDAMVAKEERRKKRKEGISRNMFAFLLGVAVLYYITSS